MEQLQLETFMYLADYENMSSVAQVMNISQPQVSKQLASLEAELGVKLFYRMGRGILLNEHGRIFQQYAADALGSMRGGRAAMLNLQNAMTGRLTINTFAFAPILNACVQAYSRQNPHITFCYTSHSSAQNLKNVDLIMGPRLHGHYTYENHFPISKNLLKEDYYIICAPKFRKYPPDQKTISVSSILDAPFILIGRHDQYATNNDYSLLEDICSYAAVSPPVVTYEVNEFYFKMLLVSEGIGMSLLPESCLKEARKIVPDLQVFSLENYAPSRTVLIAKKSPGSASPLAEDFWKFAVDYFKL